MWTRLRTLLEPMNLAAYIAWLAIGSELLSHPPLGTGVIDGPALWPILLLAHVGFLALFMARSLFSSSTRAQMWLVLGQLLLAVALVMLARYGSTGVLLIVVMAQLAQMLSPLRLVLVFLAVNLAVYLSFRGLWHSSTPLFGGTDQCQLPAICHCHRLVRIYRPTIT